MTPESKCIVELVDGYPEWVRKRMRDAMERIAVAYGMTVAKTPLRRVGDLPQNVVLLRDYRAGRAG